MKAKLIKPVFAVWIVAVAVGYGCLLNYSSTPALTTSGPSQFPHLSALKLKKKGLTLIAFFHPQCPCSVATVTELRNILQRSHFAQDDTNLKVYAVIAKPDGTGASFTKSSLVSSLESMPGVMTVAYQGDVESRRFGAQASGQILLFDQTGKKIFNGGITTERGHEGESSGGEVLSNYISGQKATLKTAPVFGCSLESSH